MKITDPRIIQTGEKNLIAAVQKHLDVETVKTILMDRLAKTSFASKGGQIVVHDNQIAFRLEFDLNVSGSLLFDRQGNYIPVASKPRPSSHEETSHEAGTSPSVPEPEDPDTKDPDLEDLEDEKETDEDDLDLMLDDEDMDDQELSGKQDAALDTLDDDDLDDDDILDDDIDDILKESREFWEQKKDS